MNTPNHGNSRLFRVVSTIVFFILLFNTIALNYPKKEGPIRRVISVVERFFLGTSSATSPTATTTSSTTTAADSVMPNGIDPSQDPPPPPPPR